MPEEIDFENWRIFNFKRLVTLTLDRVIWHNVVFQLSTSTCIPNVTGIGKSFCGRAYGRTSETHFIRSTLRSRPKNGNSLFIHIYLYVHSLSAAMLSINLLVYCRYLHDSAYPACQALWRGIMALRENDQTKPKCGITDLDIYTLSGKK